MLKKSASWGGWPGEPPVLAQRAASEGPRWTRAVGGAHPGYPWENVHEQAWKDHIRSLAAVLPAERCVSARRGWAGEKSGLSEHPAGDSGATN
jgi:hypothetical protein